MYLFIAKKYEFVTSPTTEKKNPKVICCQVATRGQVYPKVIRDSKYFMNVISSLERELCALLL